MILYETLVYVMSLICMLCTWNVLLTFLEVEVKDSAVKLVKSLHEFFIAGDDNQITFTVCRMTILGRL